MTRHERLQRQAMLAAQDGLENRKRQAMRRVSVDEARAEGSKLVKDCLNKLLRLTEGEANAQKLRYLLNPVYCRYQTPSLMLNKALEVLENKGVDVSSGVWQLSLLRCRARVREITDPKNFY